MAPLHTKAAGEMWRRELKGQRHSPSRKQAEERPAHHQAMAFRCYLK